MRRIDGQIRNIVQKTFYKLIGRPYRLKAGERDRVLDSCVVRVEGDDIVNAHPDKLLKSDGAVKGFSAASLMLPAFVEEGHNDGDPPRLSADSGDDPLQILEMIVRRHTVRMPAERIGQTVVADIDQKIKVGAPDRFLDHRLSFAGTKPRDPGV